MNRLQFLGLALGAFLLSGCASEAETSPDGRACLRTTGTLTGIVTFMDATGAPVPYATVELRLRPQDAPVKRTADAGGRYTTELEHGDWMVSAMSDDRECETSMPSAAVVSPCEETVVSLALDYCLF